MISPFRSCHANICQTVNYNNNKPEDEDHQTPHKARSKANAADSSDTDFGEAGDSDGAEDEPDPMEIDPRELEGGSKGKRGKSIAFPGKLVKSPTKVLTKKLPKTPTRLANRGKNSKLASSSQKSTPTRSKVKAVVATPTSSGQPSKPTGSLLAAKDARAKAELEVTMPKRSLLSIFRMPALGSCKGPLSPAHLFNLFMDHLEGTAKRPEQLSVSTAEAGVDSSDSITGLTPTKSKLLHKQVREVMESGQSRVPDSQSSMDIAGKSQPLVPKMGVFPMPLFLNKSAPVEASRRQVLDPLMSDFPMRFVEADEPVSLTPPPSVSVSPYVSPYGPLAPDAKKFSPQWHPSNAQSYPVQYSNSILSPTATPTSRMED